MRDCRPFLKKLFYLFDNSKIRNWYVGFSFLLHTLSFVLLTQLSKDSEFAIWTFCLASFSLIPIVLFAENLKRMVVYLLISVSAFPISLFGMFCMIQLLEFYKGGIGSVSLKSLGLSLAVPLVMTTFLIFSTTFFIVGAFILRIIVRKLIGRESSSS